MSRTLVYQPFSARDNYAQLRQVTGNGDLLVVQSQAELLRALPRWLAGKT